MQNKEDKIKIIAEVGVNHNGCMNSALRYIQAAKHAGANAVKFQLFSSEKLVTSNAKTAQYQKSHTGTSKQAELLKKLELSNDQIIALQNFANKIKIDFICTPFDIDSLKFLIKRKISVIKLSSGDFDNLFMHEEVIKNNYPVILSSGMADESEIIKILNIYKANNHKNLSMLHCVSAYPAKLSVLNLQYIARLSELFPKIKIGFSDHSTEILTGALSVMVGAKIIEKHITFSNNQLGPDHKASLTISNFKKYVSQIRLAESALGAGEKTLSKTELDIKKIARRSLAYSSDLKKDMKIQKSNLCSLRPNKGIAVMNYKKIIGKKLKKNVKKNTLVKLSDFG
jgi:N,N'-diacetyllegionaminate synthase